VILDHRPYATDKPGMRLLFIALTLLNAWRFSRTKDRWFLGLCVIFGLMVVRQSLPPLLFNVALVGVLAWVVWLGAWKFHPKLRFRHLVGNPKLRPLDAEEREWRESITGQERSSLEAWEMFTKGRFSHSEAIEFVKRQRETEKENAAGADSHKAEQEAYLAEQRAAEAEKKELGVAPLTQATEVLEPGTGKSLWLKLHAVNDEDDEDLAFTAPVRCTIWQDEPRNEEGGSESFAHLGSVIGFPPDPDGTTPKFWEGSSLEFKSMFRSRCLVAGIGVANDSRERFEFRIEDKVFVIMTKYLFWRTDLALDPNRQKLWVRISEMLSEVWLPGLDGDGDQSATFDDVARIPAFVYEIPIGRLLPSTHPEAHFETLENLQHPDE
jgi:hypothetical protein